MDKIYKRKTKVVWVCHFSDEDIQNEIPLWKKTAPYAAWIPNTLEGFKGSDEFELHIVAPHQYLKKNFSFEKDGIFYHFFTLGIPIVNRNWPFFFRLDLMTNYVCNKKKIAKIVDSINPDIVNLIGAENSYYSSSIFDLGNKYPVLITIQGFVGLEVNTRNTKLKIDRVETERKILKQFKHFAADEDSKNVIEEFRGEGDFDFFEFNYPVGSKVEKLNVNVTKEYDLLFWGRICQDKGAEDFVYIVAELKKNWVDIKALMIGPVSDEYMSSLKQMAQVLGCFDCITFRGFISETDELYEEVLKSKILVLPTYNDRLPTVLRESVILKLGVIGYAVGSIPYFNNGEERILLTEPGNKDQLVKYADLLLRDPKYFEELVLRSYNHGVQELSVKTNFEKIAEAYRFILNKNK